MLAAELHFVRPRLSDRLKLTVLAGHSRLLTLTHVVGTKDSRNSLHVFFRLFQAPILPFLTLLVPRVDRVNASIVGLLEHLGAVIMILR